MAKIKVQTLRDYEECETCGLSMADGGRIWINDEIVWEEIPVANCGIDNKCYDLGDLLKIALEKLGFEIEEI
jgi:hypothetical protein